MHEKILIIEDEKDIVRMLEYNLKKEGYATVSIRKGDGAADLAAKERPDLILLDLMLPGVDGLEVCRSIKQNENTSRIPVIVVSAKSKETDKIVGLELGADDYITKPFSPRELIARVKALLRRSAASEIGSNSVTLGILEIDFSRISVTVKGRPVELAAKEFELLKALVKARGRVLSRDYLLDNIWGFGRASEIQTRTVDVHVRTLRKKLGPAAKYIVTVKSYGYRITEDED